MRQYERKFVSHIMQQKTEVYPAFHGIQVDGYVEDPSTYGVTYTFAESISESDIVPVTLQLSNGDDGNTVNIELTIPPGEGDLLGFFGNVVDESIVSTMSVSDTTGIITEGQFDANKIKKVGPGNDVNPAKKWDFGLKIGDQGNSGGSVESAEFQLME